MALALLLACGVGVLATEQEVEGGGTEMVGSLASSISGSLSWIMSGAGNELTNSVAQAVERQAEEMLSNAFSFLKLSSEVVAHLLGMLANLGFCAVLAMGFNYLSADAMLVVGLVTFFIGPTLVLLLINVVLGLVYTAANSPLVFVLLVCLLAFLRSRIGQFVGKSLGLDINQDGTVGIKDLFAALRQCRCQLPSCIEGDWSMKARDSSWAQALVGQPFFSRLQSELDSAFSKPDMTIEGLSSRMDELDKKMDKVLELLGSNAHSA